MGKSITTSTRLSGETRQRLEFASRNLDHGMNWIINEALQFYLNRHVTQYHNRLE